MRDKFETIRTEENMDKPLQQQQIRCKVCKEQMVGRPNRMKEHLARCNRPSTSAQVR